MSLLSRLLVINKNNIKRVGRGIGSGKGGHYSGRGGKGHTARTGGKTPLWFEGGQLSFVRRFPWQRGKSRFNSLKKFQEVQLSKVVAAGLTEVNRETLLKAKLIEDIKVAKSSIRLIGAMKLTQKIQATGVEVSSTVRKSIEEAGGTVSL
jgi:large subunit ribosomal protein L15